MFCFMENGVEENYASPALRRGPSPLLGRREGGFRNIDANLNVDFGLGGKRYVLFQPGSRLRFGRQAPYCVPAGGSVWIWATSAILCSNWEVGFGLGNKGHIV